MKKKKLFCYHIDFVWYCSEQIEYHCGYPGYGDHSCCGFVPNCPHVELDLFPPKKYPVLLPGKELSHRLGYI